MTASLRTKEDKRKQLAAAAARDFEVSQTEAWDQLSSISSNTSIDTVEIFDDEIVVRGDQFAGPLVWYVSLNYGNGDDAFSSSDSFPGKFEGHFEGKRAVITRMTADVSSFYK